MRNSLRYSAGEPGQYPTVFRLDRRRAALRDVESALVSRFLEIWCVAECHGRWQVVETDESIDVGFESDVDVMNFVFSEDGQRFKKATVIEQ